MAVDPLIVQAEAKYRASLLAGDTNSRAALFKAYSGTYKSLETSIQGITAQINAAKEAGEAISASWLMQQQRYRDLQAQSALLMRNLTGSLGSNLPLDQQNAAKAAEMLVGQNAGPIFNKLPAAAVEGVVGTTTSGSPLRTLLDSFNVNGTQDASRFLRSRLIAGVASGTAPINLAKQLTQGVESLTLSRALTISRTETQRALRRATQLSIAANSQYVAGWVWRSGADERTCAACFSLHGTFFPGSTPMRAHPNCRCIMIPKRIVKNDPYGFGTGVKVGNGGELFKALPESSQLKILGPGRYDLYKSGKVTLNQMRTIRNNQMWGPSYQVKALRDIKADLDKPPPAPKAPKPPPPPKPTSGPPSAPVVDEVLEAEKTAQAAPVAAPSAPKPAVVNKQQVKIAAEESKLLEIAEAEKRFAASGIPEMNQGLLDVWRHGGLQDTHIVKHRVTTRIDSIYELPSELRSLLNASYSADANGHFYYMSRNVERLADGWIQEFTMWRTTRRVPTPYGVNPFLQPTLRDKVFRALPSQTADIQTILRKAATEKRLYDAKIQYERLLNPDLTPKRAARKIEPPREITADEMHAAGQRVVDAKARAGIQPRDMKYDTMEDFIGAGDLTGYVDYNVAGVWAMRKGVGIGSMGQSLVDDILFEPAFHNGERVLLATRLKVGTQDLLKTRSRSAGGLTIEGGGLRDLSINPILRDSDEWLSLLRADLTEFRTARQDLIDLQRAATARYEYEVLAKIRGKTPIAEVPTQLSGASAPIPVTSSFTGAPRKWTLREAKTNDLHGGLAEQAKDQVSTRIAARLHKDDAFIKSLAENDRLGEWVENAGRSPRPAVREAAQHWRSWTPEQREAFLRSGEVNPGYYQWYTSMSYGIDGPAAMTLNKGMWVKSSASDGAAFIYDYSSQMVQQWAVTSGDAHILSVGLQRAAMEEFSLQATTTLAHFEGRMHRGGFGVSEGDLLSASEAFYDTNGIALRRFLRHMYDETQEELAIAGIKTVRAIRGVDSTPRALAAELQQTGAAFERGMHVEGPVDLQPMSSFAVDTTTAKKFGGMLIYVDVPASWIVGTCRTGFGCLNEFEWVILGGPMRATVHNAGRF